MCGGRHDRKPNPGSQGGGALRPPIHRAGRGHPSHASCAHILSSPTGIPDSWTCPCARVEGRLRWEADPCAGTALARPLPGPWSPHTPRDSLALPPQAPRAPSPSGALLPSRRSLHTHQVSTALKAPVSPWKSLYVFRACQWNLVWKEALHGLQGPGRPSQSSCSGLRNRSHLTSWAGAMGHDGREAGTTCGTGPMNRWPWTAGADHVPTPSSCDDVFKNVTLLGVPGDSVS